MPRPCTCNNCRLCVLYNTSPKHRRHWDGQAEPVVDPSLARKALNFGKALASHVATGRKLVPLPIADERLAICKACPSGLYKDGRCRHISCGCNMAKKVTWAEQACPIGHWDAYTETTSIEV